MHRSSFQDLKESVTFSPSALLCLAVVENIEYTTTKYKHTRGIISRPLSSLKHVISARGIANDPYPYPCRGGMLVCRTWERGSGVD